jgi:hypothetical protein
MQLTPQALPVPITTPAAAVQRDSSAIRARVFPGRQHTTADGRPQVERAAQRTMPRISSLRQRLLLSVLRKWATQRTYAPWLTAVSHGHAAASAAATSAGHGMGSGFPRRAIALAGSARRTARTSRRREARIVDLRGESFQEVGVRALCQARRAPDPHGIGAKRVTVRHWSGTHRAPRQMRVDPGASKAPMSQGAGSRDTPR